MNDEARGAARSKAFAITFPDPTEPRGWAEHYFEVGFDAGYDAGQAAQWVPVSERLPDEDGHCAVTLKSTSSGFQWDTTVMWFDNEYGWCEPGRADYIPDANANSVIAWMPLPEPSVKEKV